MSGLKRRSGQAVVEWALIVPLYGLLFVGFFAFIQWFGIHQQLLIAAKQGAFLYSTGRIPKPQVRLIIQRELLRSHPSLRVSVRDIDIGPLEGFQGRLHKLDRVRVRYVPSERLLRFFSRSRPLEESCVIKHAPGYWKFFGAQVGPPVPW